MEFNPYVYHKSRGSFYSSHQQKFQFPWDPLLFRLSITERIKVLIILDKISDLDKDESKKEFERGHSQHNPYVFESQLHSKLHKKQPHTHLIPITPTSPNKYQGSKVILS
ncbi:extracellular sulfatase Sulf-1 [Platysternon megacephalum]|uniref:Extracellular sulfatase Sulf-1 n=1 Tax=Platysternon megacephalum TaxID=55544 RepID=A0A4D9E4X2_9SAUR|nr:extracellular sulfatase Sulf-1 [Platysternon megacephalum]